MEIENENILLAALTTGLNLFLGSGFSVLAKDKRGVELPSGGTLSSELCREFQLNQHSSLQLAQLCTIIEHSQQAALRAYLENRFTVGEFAPEYRNLELVKVKSIFTTNIDDLPHKIYAGSASHYINDIDAVGPAFQERSAIDLVTLHGCVNDKTRPLRFGSTELASAFASDADRWHFLTQRLQQFPTLFWGYSLNDAGTLQALSPETVRGRQHQDKWVLLRPANADSATISFFQALGFRIIKSDTSEMLQWIRKNAIGSVGPLMVSRTTKSLFPSEALPEVGTVPVRPLLEFFLGSPPQWSDIYGGHLYATSQLDRVRDSVYSRKHTLILGLPACGKTTILMRVAAESKFAGHKLMCGSLTLEKAELIESRLNKEPALIFVDNFADSIDAFEHLSRCDNIQVTGADRDYNFVRVSHRVDSSAFNILDVTDLSASDIQGCLATIPQDIRFGGNNRPPTALGEVPSLFEIIEANVKTPTLRERFRSVLEELRRDDIRLHDLLLMVSYVHRCRTPVSFDMIMAFMREVTSDFREVSIMCRKLGEMITEYRGELEDTVQDHFVPRSTIVADAVITAATDNSLRMLLLRFFDSVSSYRICRYDVFRRNAYDADLAVRAFPSWEEGQQFYRDLYARDTSPYNLQQGAVYLARKHRYTEAFEMIDQAVLKSGGRVWSIRNSHAIILFRANIRYSEEPNARQTLKQSMNILTECYKWDKRKPFHAVTFADQALELWRVFGDEEARAYLETARKWLREESKRSPWNRAVKHLLPKIERVLAEQ